MLVTAFSGTGEYKMLNCGSVPRDARGFGCVARGTGLAAEPDTLR